MRSRSLASTLDIIEVQGASFGIEVEVEQALDSEYADESEEQRRSLSTDLVKCVHDGSLRDRGCEFIFAKPLEVSSQDFNTAVQYIQDVCEELEVASSYRTSTHFHMNISDLTHSEIKNVLFLSVMIESALMEYCSEHRKNNRFCIPWGSDFGLVERVQYNRGLRDLPYAMQDTSKYSSTSLHRMHDLGTIEYRMFDSIHDAETLRKICRFFASVRTIACTKTLDQIREDKIQGRLLDNLTRLIRDCFGEKVPRHKLEMCLDIGVNIALDLIEPLFDHNKILEIQNAIREQNTSKDTDTQLEQGADSQRPEQQPQSVHDERTTYNPSWLGGANIRTTPTPQPAPARSESGFRPSFSDWTDGHTYRSPEDIERAIQRWRQEVSLSEDAGSGRTDTSGESE